MKGHRVEYLNNKISCLPLPSKVMILITVIAKIWFSLVKTKKIIIENVFMVKFCKNKDSLPWFEKFSFDP